MVLLIAALGLLVLEAKVGGHGALAVAGIACLTFGMLTLVAAPVPELGVNPLIAIAVSVAFGGITVFSVAARRPGAANEVAPWSGRACGARSAGAWKRSRPKAMYRWRARSGALCRPSQSRPAPQCAWSVISEYLLRVEPQRQ